ncbi:hypothetical protein O181_032022 [Austropuccinia psidii MF-1]|uniref:Uncharacterized protein n=1 Tax=Austropuccinia psidii MF-1 TaxID=1389203 RepID=A0A9Q3CYP5_9BASI|nr:hypothetical protein [Austropuccinia psidii MF-1]
MGSSRELGIEVESQSHEDNQDPPVLPESFISSQTSSSQKPNFKSYEKEKTVEPCAPTEDYGKDDLIFSGEVEIISKKQFVSNIAQTIPRLKKIQNDSTIPDYVRQKIAEAMSLLKMDLNHKSIINSIQNLEKRCLKYMGRCGGKGLGKRPNIHATKKTNKKHCTFEAAKDSWDQGDEMINVEVHNIYNEPPHTESPPILNKIIHEETPPASPQNIQAFKERETIKHDTMGQYMTDILPNPDPKVSSSANFQGIFLCHMEEFGEILNYHSNITQQSWKRGLDNINRIYKNHWDNLPTKDAYTFLPVGIKVISNQELKMLAWLEYTGLDFLNPTETEAFFDHNIWNLELMKESAKPPDNLPKSEHSFFKMVQSLLYPSNPVKHFWENVIFESISLVSYNFSAPKPYVAPTSNLTDPLGLKRGQLNTLPPA